MIIKLIIITLAFWSGIATYYPAERFSGRPLYCDQFTDQDLVYDESTPSWAAFDVSWYRQGLVACGDEVLVMFDDGGFLVAKAWDAGKFKGRWVSTWPDSPIIVDLPEHLRPDENWSWRVRVVNLTRLERIEP